MGLNSQGGSKCAFAEIMDEGLGYYPVSSTDRRDIQDVPTDELDKIVEGIISGKNVDGGDLCESGELSKFEIALSFVNNHLKVLIPDLKEKMAEVDVADEDNDEVMAWMLMANMGELCDEFCSVVAREIKGLSYVYYESILGLIEVEFCIAKIEPPEDSSWTGVIDGIVKKERQV